jgi:IS30 family transposase
VVAELIVGRPRSKPPQRPSHEAIYQWIYLEARELTGRRLPASAALRRGYSRKHLNPISLSVFRSANAPLRSQATPARALGGRHRALQPRSSGLAVALERKSRYTNATPARQPPISCLLSAMARTRGARAAPSLRQRHQNTDHLAVNRVLGSTSYFCEPMHSWEKGSVENRIGLIRRRYPKGVDFGYLPHRAIRQLEYSLNHRPCKLLNFRTPAETFNLERCT